MTLDGRRLDEIFDAQFHPLSTRLKNGILNEMYVRMGWEWCESNKITVRDVLEKITPERLAEVENIGKGSVKEFKRWLAEVKE